MKKGKLILIILAVLLILTGAGMMAGAYLAMSRNASAMNTEMEFTENTHIIEDDFSTIRISTVNSSVALLPSSDGVCRVVCDDSEKLYHQIAVNRSETGAQLNIDQRDEWQWFELLFGLHDTDEIMLRVYLPETEYALVHADSSSGDISIGSGFSFGTLSAMTASGNISLCDFNTGYLTAVSTSGDLMLRSVSAEADIAAENDSGFTRLENLQAANVTAASTSGNLNLEIISSGYLRTTAISGNILVLGGDFHETSYFENGSGSIEIVDSQCGEQSIQSISGSVTLQNVRGESLNASANSGKILLEDALYDSNVLCQTTSGEILFTGLDGGNLEFSTVSSEVSGNLLSGKVFITETASGYVSIPPSDERGGTCHIQTVSGNISIAIEQ